MRVCARVSRFETDATKSMLYLSDGTHAAPVRADCFVEDSAFYLERVESWRQCPLVDCVLAVKNQGGQMVLTVPALGCVALADSNALTHHMLEVANAHLVATRGALPRTGGAGAGHGGGGAGAGGHAAAQALYSASFGAGAGGAGGAGGPAGDSEAVLQLFRELSADTEGATPAQVAQRAAQLPGMQHLSKEQVAAITEKLMLDGHIYSTVDEQTYKTTG